MDLNSYLDDFIQFVYFIYLDENLFIFKKKHRLFLQTTRPLQNRVKDIFSKEYARITILTMVFG